MRKCFLSIIILLLHIGSAMARNLGPGAELTTNQSICSDSGGYCLVLQADNNLVLYGQNSQPLWASNTVGTGAVRATMQSDGNFVLCTSTNVAVWSAQENHPGSYLAVQDDGNLVLYWPRPIWQSGTSDPSNIQGNQTFIFNSNDQLTPGNCYSIGALCFVFQTDGNLVLYKSGTAAWAAGSNGARTAVMQSDGNFVLYDGQRAVWSTGTQSSAGAYFAFQGDGNLVIYAPTPVWDRFSGALPLPGSAPVPVTPIPRPPPSYCGTVNPFACSPGPMFPVYYWKSAT